jgi:hypothetical protein
MIWVESDLAWVLVVAYIPVAGVDVDGVELLVGCVGDDSLACISGRFVFLRLTNFLIFPFVVFDFYLSLVLDFW